MGWDNIDFFCGVRYHEKKMKGESPLGSANTKNRKRGKIR
jgi:hypothetical protein